MEKRLSELYEGVAVHATADLEHMAALELLALVMLADSHLSDDELGVLRRAHRGLAGSAAFSFEQYLGPAVAKARAAFAQGKIGPSCSTTSTPASPAGSSARRCSPPSVSSSVTTPPEEDALVQDVAVRFG